MKCAARGGGYANPQNQCKKSMYPIKVSLYLSVSLPLSLSLSLPSAQEPHTAAVKQLSAPDFGHKYYKSLLRSYQ